MKSTQLVFFTKFCQRFAQVHTLFIPSLSKNILKLEIHACSNPSPLTNITLVPEALGCLHELGMGRYRYQILDTIDTRALKESIDTGKKYRLFRYF